MSVGLSVVRSDVNSVALKANETVKVLRTKFIKRLRVLLKVVDSVVKTLDVNCVLNFMSKSFTKISRFKSSIALFNHKL